MTREYDNTNTGIIGKNDRKEKDTHPDYRGSLTQIECPCCKAKNDYWLSGWTKYNRNTGEPFVSLAATVKDPNYAKKDAPPKPKVDDFLGAPSKPEFKTPLDGGSADYDDDISF